MSRQSRFLRPASRRRSRQRYDGPPLSDARLEAYLVTRLQAFLEGIRKIIAHDNKELPKEAHGNTLERGKVPPVLETAPGSDWQLLTAATGTANRLIADLGH